MNSRTENPFTFGILVGTITTGPPDLKDPDNGGIWPARVFMRVVFPLPLRPVTIMQDPSG